ncbi:molybdopterin converting factor subunit 1 [Salinarimonas soli]|nr:molybdopterin converting factor subunit 1 [Salinarimonas soli]
MKVSYFSWLRLKTGTAAEEIQLPEDCRTLSELVTHLTGRHPALGEIADARGAMRFTVNRRYVEGTHVLSATDEVGLFPPVTGG